MIVELLEFAIRGALIGASRGALFATRNREARVDEGAPVPGLVETPMTANWPDMLEMWKARSPMKRPAKPEDIADLVAALCANDYVTGEIVIADGGLNLT